VFSYCTVLETVADVHAVAVLNTSLTKVNAEKNIYSSALTGFLQK
jgi:hypothetical protein